MRNWLSSVALMAAGAASAFAQQGGTDPYEQLRAPAMAAYEAGETARAYALFEEVFAQIPETDPAERAATAFSLGILAHQSDDRPLALEWLEQGFALHETARTSPSDYAQYVAYAGTVSAEDGEHSAAVDWFRQALEAIADTDETRELRANTFNQVANALHAQGQYYEASERRRNALAAYTQVYGPDHAFVGIVLEGLAEDVLADGHEAEAIDARREALRIALITREPDDLTVVTLAGTLAGQLAERDDTGGIGDVADLVEAHSGNDRHRARILSEIASRARSGGETDIAAELHERAYRAAAADTQTPPDYLATYLSNHAIGVQQVSGYAAALPLLEEHLAFVRRIDSDTGLRTAAASERVWTAHFRLARFAEAEANARERLENLNARADYPATEIGRAYENLALSLHELYRPNEAGPVFARALEVLEGNHEARGILASLLDAYAIHLVFHEDRAEALQIARRNAALRAELYGSGSRSYARGLYTLATVQRRSDLGEEALETLDQADAIYDGLGESAIPARVDVMIQRAQIAYEQGRLAETDATLVEADMLISPARADQRRDWHDMMGRLRRTQGRLTEALSHFREVLALRIAQDGEEARANVFPILQIATTLRGQGDLDAAEAMTRRALAIHEAYGITTGSDVGVAWGELATILSMQGRGEEALEASHMSSALIAEEWPRGTQRRALQEFNHAILIMRNVGYAEAERAMRSAINDFRNAEGRSDVFLGTMVTALGYVLDQQGEYRQAAAAYREGLELRDTGLSNDSPALASSRAFLARVLIDHLGEPQQGLNLFREASNGLIEGIEMRAGTAADEGVDGVEFAQKDAFFTAHLEALWTNAHMD